MPVCTGHFFFLTVALNKIGIGKINCQVFIEVYVPAGEIQPFSFPDVAKIGSDVKPNILKRGKGKSSNWGKGSSDNCLSWKFPSLWKDYLSFSVAHKVKANVHSRTQTANNNLIMVSTLPQLEKK